MLMHSESFVAVPDEGSWIGNFFENGHVKKLTEEDFKELDFVQLTYLHDYFKRRLDVSNRISYEIKQRWGNWLYEAKSHEDNSEFVEDYFRRIAYHNDVDVYLKCIPVLANLIVEDLRRRLNIVV